MPALTEASPPSDPDQQRAARAYGRARRRLGLASGIVRLALLVLVALAGQRIADALDVPGPLLVDAIVFAVVVGGVFELVLAAVRLRPLPPRTRRGDLAAGHRRLVARSREGLADRARAGRARDRDRRLARQRGAALVVGDRRRGVDPARARPDRARPGAAAAAVPALAPALARHAARRPARRWRRGRGSRSDRSACSRRAPRPPRPTPP